MRDNMINNNFLKNTKQNMKKILLLIMAMFVSDQVFSQANKSKKTQELTKKSSSSNQRQSLQTPSIFLDANLIWSETFSTSDPNTGDQSTPAQERGWNLTQLGQLGPQPNLWFISSTEAGSTLNSCRKSFLEDNLNLNNTLHIGFQNAGTPINGLKEDFGAKYFRNSNSFCDWRIESPQINIKNKVNLSISFDYFYCGDGQNDVLQLWYTDNDNNWQILHQFTPSELSNNCGDPIVSKPVWVKFGNMSIPRTEESDNLIIAFRWSNSGDGDNESESWSCAIDNIRIVGETLTETSNSDPILRQQSQPHLNEGLIEPGLLWSENFGTSIDQNSADKGNQAVSFGWSRTETGQNGPKSNQWFVSATAPGIDAAGSCSESWPLNASANTSNRSLHIGNFGSSQDGDEGAFYKFTEENITDIRIESPFINAVGKSDLEISFDYYCGGDGISNVLEFYCFDGNDWILVTTFLPSDPGNCMVDGDNNQTQISKWTRIQGLVLPESTDNSNLKIAFRWRNSIVSSNSTNEISPISAAIDNIKIYNKAIVSNTTVIEQTTKTSINLNSKITNNKSEINFTSNDGSLFTIESSIDGVSFQPIASLTPNQSGFYKFTDMNSKEGTNYYRVIKKVGKSSIISQTVITEISPENKIKFTIYPNPNSGQFVVDFGGIENNFLVELILLDENGNKVYSTQFDINSLRDGKLNVIPESNLKNGRYYCTLAIEGIKYTSIVIVK